MASLFTSQTPTVTDASDGAPGIETATTVRFAEPGTVTHVRFYATDTVGGVYTVQLYEITANDAGSGGAGLLLASAVAGVTPTPGWNTVAITPQVITPNTKLYRACMHNSAGRYVATLGFFGADLVNGPITADRDTDDPVGLGLLSQGTFVIDAAPQYPRQTGNGACYFVDVVFEPEAAGIDGAGTVLLPAVDVAGAGAVSLTCAGAAALPAIDVAGAGSVALDGDGLVALPALDVAGAGTVTFDGDGVITLPAVDMAGAGTVETPAPGGITGAGVIALPALTTIGTGDVMTCQPLLYDTSCLPAGWATNPAELVGGQRSAYEFAVEMLNDLTLHQYGLCVRVARPCSAACAVGAGYMRADGGWFRPYLYGGRVFNACGCQAATLCGCGDSRSTVVLAGPVAEVVQVLVDGQVVDPDAYRVDNGTLLVRTDGGQWPLRQDLAAPPSSPDTFAVTYMQGTALPRGGMVALRALMIELHKGLCGTPGCRLPSKVTSVVREGVTYSMMDDPTVLLDAGLTGISEVDVWLRSVNPHGTRTRMAVWSPDLGRRR